MKRNNLLFTLIITFAFVIIFPYKVSASDNIIRIRSISDLNNVRNDLSAHYILLNDLDLTEATMPNTGDYSYGVNGWLPLGCDGNYQIVQPFTGIFDGNGHTIKGLCISMQRPDSVNESYYLGFLGMNKGLIKNITFSNSNIQYAMFPSSNQEKAVVGTICAVNAGTIKNCSVSGIIAGSCGKKYSNNSSDVVSGSFGGVAGIAKSGAKFERCISSCNIEYDVGYVNKDYYTDCTAIAYVGGICGESEDNNVSIKYCCNYGNITRLKKRVFGKAEFYVAGIVGSTLGVVDNCYNAGTISHSYPFVGIGGSEVSNSYTVGTFSGDPARAYAMTPNGTVSNCYYKNGTLGLFGRNDGSLPIADDQLSNPDSFSGFDFSAVWSIDPSAEYTYPSFRDEIDLIEVTVPNKTAYYTGDIINLTGGSITIFYMSGQTEIIDLLDDYLSGYDMDTVGRQNVTVTYLNHVDSYQIVVTQRPELSELNLLSPPNKTEFARGTKFDFTGCQAEAVYVNGATEIIDIDDTMTSGGDINQSGTYTITYTFLGKTVSFQVKVVPVRMTNIEVTSMPKQTVYVPGEPFNKNGMVVEGVYNNDTREDITEYSVGQMPSELGEHELVISYNNLTTSITINIEQQAPVDLMVTKNPDKTQYVEGEIFDNNGMIVCGIYNSGYSEELQDYSVSAIPEGTGRKTLTITYGNITTTITITVIQKELLQIAIKQTPNKMEYIEGENFEPEGLIVTGLFNNNLEEEIDDYRITNIDTSTIGTNRIYVSYQGFSASFNITVMAKQLKRITANEPNKVDYLPDEEFDSEGLVVTAYYDNGTSEEVADYTIEGFTGRPGESLIIVTYQGKQTNFVVTVHKPSGVWTVVEEASCSKEGKQVQYCEDCDKVLFEEKIEKKAHTPVDVAGYDATCAEDGLTDGKKCSVCEEILVKQTVIKAKGHTEVKIDGKPATCTEDGLTDGIECSVCHKILTPQNVIKAEHSWNKDFTIDKPATCTELGSKSIHCSKCSATKDTTAISTIGHKIVAIPGKKATTTSTGLTEGKKCSVCGKIITPQQVIPKLIPQKASDGTTVGAGASQSIAETSIIAATSDEGPAGTKFALLQAQMKKVTKNSITIKWKGISGAKYIVYGNACGKGKKYQKLTELSGTSYTQKGLKKDTYYKYMIVAVKEGKVVSTSKTLHIATAGGKVGNNTKVTLSKKKLTLKAGKSKKLKATAKKGKLKVKKHRKVMWESSDPTVATVSNSGKIKAVSNGKAIIYAYAQNGKFAKCTVTVK